MRILAMMHKSLVPPDSLDGYADDEIAIWKTEYDVTASLYNQGHEVRALGIESDLGELRREVESFRPHIVFNLLEEFGGEAVYDQNVVSYLELLRLPYTGCAPRGLILARDKAVSKLILNHHRIPVPEFAVFPRGRVGKRPRKLGFPLIVKSLNEEASLGISQASIVHDDARLAERVEFIHRSVGTDAIAEQYIEGREFYVGVIGNHRLLVFPVWELLFTKAPGVVHRIATAKAKHDEDYQKRIGIVTRQAGDLDTDQVRYIEKLCKRIYRALGLNGYARIDFRMSPHGQVYALEANPNPELAYGEDFAESAEAAGMSYDQLIHRIVNLGLRWARG